MAIERVNPISNDGIELYVSEKGDESGASQTGLARLCGIDESTLRRLLSDRHKMALILGEDIPTEDLYLGITSNQQAKIIKSKYCTKIIQYYAFTAKNKTETAAYSLGKFADIGFHTWVKESVGYIETHGNIDQRLYDLLAVMSDDIKTMKADLASTSGYRAARIELPGLREWMESLTDHDRDQLALPAAEGERLFTLVEWAEFDQDGMILAKNQKHSLANLVSATYKTMALDMPQKVVRLNEKGYKLAPVQAYPQRHFTLIRMCFAKLVNK
jgi:hypothetical protein